MKICNMNAKGMGHTYKNELAYDAKITCGSLGNMYLAFCMAAV